MVGNLKNKREQGFTIIEVLIVLAIAGVILLALFQAVPALQRSSRNTTIKQDASSLASGISEYMSNNNGALPSTLTAGSTAGTYVIGGVGTTNTVTVQLNGGTNVNLGELTTQYPSARTYNNLWWKSKVTCTNPTVTTGSRSFVVYYYVESSSTSTTPSCIDAA